MVDVVGVFDFLGEERLSEVQAATARICANEDYGGSTGNMTFSATERTFNYNFFLNRQTKL